MLKIWCKCQKWGKNWENILGFGANIIWNDVVKHSLLRRDRILVIGRHYVKKQDQDFRYYLERIFPTELLSGW